MASHTIHVKNISGLTDDKEIRDFFAFCGKISDLQVTTDEKTKNANITFEKETALKTALLLSNTQLGPNVITVESANGTPGDDVAPTTNPDRDSDELTQEEKPRSRIFAEYLAHGYVVGDATLQKALDLDSKHSVSSRFLSTLQNLDTKYHASDKAKTVDQSYGISQRANSLLTGISSYFEKASNTPTGKRIADFYTNSSRQVQDIHAEARRLADLKKDEHGGSAYKASGLEKVFGQEKTAPASTGDNTGTTQATPVVPSAANPVTAPDAPVSADKA